MDKEYDDQVYEDEYYKDNEEELKEDSDDSDSSEKSDETPGRKVHLSYVCDDCDYRWEDVVTKVEGNLEDEVDDVDAACPMCGSLSVLQI